MTNVKLDLRSLRYVAELARTANFHRAADALFISQPALTKRIQHAESLLGLPLFDRVKGGVIPTAYGKLVVASAKRIMAELDSLESELSEASGGEIGSLIIGCGPHVAQTFLPNALIGFTRQAPKVEVKVVVENCVRLTEMLRDGELDLFISDTEEIQNHDDLEIRALPTSRGVIVCRQGHPLIGKLLSPEHLLEYPLATASLPSRVIHWLRDMAPASWSAEEYCRQVLRLSCDSHDVLLYLVKSSDYLTIVPKMLMLSEVYSKGLHGLHLSDAISLPDFSPGLVSLRTRSISPAGKLMLSLLESQLSKAAEMQ